MLLKGFYAHELFSFAIALYVTVNLGIFTCERPRTAPFRPGPFGAFVATAIFLSYGMCLMTYSHNKELILTKN